MPTMSFPISQEGRGSPKCHQQGPRSRTPVGVTCTQRRLQIWNKTGKGEIL